ncbi:MAG: Crp/Fnr family transcriptional regulator [Neptuniibacter sp.]
MELTPKALNQIRLLADLTPQEKEQLSRLLHVVECKKNELVVRKGQPSSELYFLISGRLKVVDYSADGREVGFIFIESGAHFGELALIDGKPRSASIVATERSIVAYLNSVEAQRLMFAVPSVSEKLLKQLANIIRQNNEHIVMLGSNSAQSRIAILLLKYARECQDGLVIQNLPSQNEIAIMTNTTRETVSRTLNLLSEQAIIHKKGKCITIPDPDLLDAFAEKH